MVTTDARALVVLGGVAGKLEELSGQVASAQVGARYSRTAAMCGSESENRKPGRRRPRAWRTLPDAGAAGI